MCQPCKHQHAPKNHNAEERDGGEAKDEDGRVSTRRHEPTVGTRECECVAEDEPLEVVIVMVESVPEAKCRQYGDCHMRLSSFVPQRNKRYYAHWIEEDALPPAELTNRRLIGQLE